MVNAPHIRTTYATAASVLSKYLHGSCKLTPGHLLHVTFETVGSFGSSIADFGCGVRFRDHATLPGGVFCMIGLRV